MGLFFFLLVTMGCALEWNDPIGSIQTRPDGSQVLQKHAPIFNLAFERLRTLWRSCENPFDCKIQWNYHVWPKYVLTDLVESIRIDNGTISVDWVNIMLHVSHETGTMVPMYTFHIVIDKEAWLEKPEPLHWRDPPPVFMAELVPTEIDNTTI